MPQAKHRIKWSARHNMWFAGTGNTEIYAFTRELNQLNWRMRWSIHPRT